MRILFLCTGNSCRSQMAEGFARRFAADAAEIYSAGTSPVGIHARAIAVMKEADVPLTRHRSKGLVDVPSTFDLVITLCGDAAETCPTFSAGTEIRHWPIEDPARASGNEEEVNSFFRSVRDELRERAWRLLREHDLLRADATSFDSRGE